MSEKVMLKVMRCPTCGGNLNVENDTDAIECVYCGNTIVPVNEGNTASAAAPAGEAAATFSGVVKVEGIKTPSSALAYIDQFFEEYDWEVFTYAPTISVPEIDKLANSLKMTSADDKNTWFVCFKAMSVPYLYKVEGCKRILATVVAEYKKNSLDAYSRFDAYKRIASTINRSKDSVVAGLEKFVANASKYGALAAEVAGFNAEIQNVINTASVEVYGDVEDIPAIKEFIVEKNNQIVRELAAEGIDAESEYLCAKALIDMKKYGEALSVLLPLRGYSDTDKLIEKIDKYYLITNVLEVEGNLYYFRIADVKTGLLNLYPTVGGKISNKPIIKKISKIVTNYADNIYYLDKKYRLKKYCLSDKTNQKVYGKSLKPDVIYVYDRRIFLLGPNGKMESCNSLLELNLATGAIKPIVEKVNDIVSLTGNKLIYTVKGISERIDANVINVDTLEITALGSKKISIEGFVDNYVVYTQESPNLYNKNLYIKALGSEEPEKLVEANIFRFCDIIAGKLFFYVGNARNQSLININCDGTGRRQLPLNITKFLFEQGGWIYFIRKVGHNAILCKSRIDGGSFTVIASDIEEFIEIKNGYMYYINFASKLVKVRMDGSNLQVLCDDVESVLAVKEDKIIFVSIDGRHGVDGKAVVKSIYAVEFNGSGKKKLVYNVNNAKNYDENTVYYVADDEINKSYDTLDQSHQFLYSLDVETNLTDKLLDLEFTKNSLGFVIAMIVMLIALLVGVAGFANNSLEVGAGGLAVGVVSLFVGLAIKAKRK